MSLFVPSPFCVSSARSPICSTKVCEVPSDPRDAHSALVQYEILYI